MPSDYREYLKPENISKLASINLQAKLIVEGFITGLHKSPYHGFSVEFAEYRQYTNGDEIRRVDWKVYGRTGKYYIKRFEQETNLRAYIFLDTSKSMAYRSDKAAVTKAEYSGYLAAALTLLLIKQRDAVGFVPFNSRLEKVLSPSLKESHQTQILKSIASYAKDTAEERQTNMREALAPFIRQIQPRSLSIVISDLWEKPEDAIPVLKLLRHKQNEVIVFHVLDPREKDLQFSSGARTEFVDIEIGKKLTTSPVQIQKAYQKAFAAHAGAYEEQLLNNGIDYMQIDTTTPFDAAMLAYFKKRQRMRR